jgi:hypothetical protein
MNSQLLGENPGCSSQGEALLVWQTDVTRNEGEEKQNADVGGY